MSKVAKLLLAASTLAVAAPALAQDAAEGAKKAAMCIGCHGIPGYQTSFPEVYKVPKIAGQNAAYIASALGSYKKGERKHPTMRAIAATLGDKDIGDLAAYYEKQAGSMVKAVADAPAAQAPAEVASLIAKGACVSCHGPNFSKPINPAYPKLAGQHGDYLAAALRAYGVEGNANVGRANPIMGAQVKPFKPAELKALADYLATLPSELATVPQSRFK